MILKPGVTVQSGDIIANENGYATRADLTTPGSPVVGIYWGSERTGPIDIIIAEAPQRLNFADTIDDSDIGRVVWVASRNTVRVAHALGDRAPPAGILQQNRVVRFINNAHHEPLIDDLQGQVGIYPAGVSSLVYEAYGNSLVYVNFFRHDQDDTAFFVVQTTHRWDPLTSLSLHLHVVPMAASGGDVRVRLRYTTAPLFQTLDPSVANWTTVLTTTALTVDDQYKQKLIELATVPAITGATSSTIIMFEITRLGTDVLDTYSGAKTVAGTAQANLAFLYADCHVTNYRHGSGY